jgi:hypothetical protein
MRLHASRKGFCDRAVEIVYQSLLCDLGSMLEARGLDSPHQVEAEVGPVIIRAIKRPHDLEALEYGEDLVVYLEPFMGRFPREIAAMGIEPPLSRAVPFPLLPSKRLVDLRERLNRLPRWFAR